MATTITVKGKTTRRPGMYSQTKSGVKNSPTGLSFGNVLLIDTNNLLNDWAAGAGINGELSNNNNAFYTFDNIDDFRDHVKGGYLWKLAVPLFKPKKGKPGASSITVVKPATTTAAEIQLTGLANGSLTIQPLDEGTGANGVESSSILTKGYAARLYAGTVDTSKVFLKFFRGTFRGNDTFNSGKYFNKIAAENTKPELLVTSPEFSTLQECVSWMQSDNTFKSFFRLKSNYTVADAEISSITCIADTTNSLNGDYFTINTTTTSYYVWYKTSGGVETDPAIVGKTGIKVTVPTDSTATNVAIATAAALDALPAFTVPVPSTPTLLATAAVSGTVIDVTANTSGFTVSVTNQGGSVFTSGDLVTYSGNVLATGATESSSSTDLDLVLEYINDLDFSFILSTHNGDNAQSTENSTILSWLQETSKYERFLMIGGGQDSSKFKLADTNSSLASAAYFDSDLVCVIHGGEKEAIVGSIDYNVYDSLYKTFQVTGRTSGLAPQTPLTLKDLDIDGEVHLLTEKEQEAALAGGVLYTYYDSDLESFVIGQGITTIQDNDNIINEDNSTFSLQVKRIQSQLNKELVYEAKRKFYSSEIGPNRNTLSTESIAAFIEGFLSKKIARGTSDNLIIDFRNITVTESEDNFEASYEFVPNFEVNKGLFTGFVLEK